MAGRLIILLFFLSCNLFAGMLPRNVWYVRPVTGEYGPEDGTSYATAFDGFAGIDWNSIQPNDYLYLCDNFVNEVLTVGKSGTANNPIWIRGYNGYASIDGISTQVSGIDINSKNYITVSDIFLTAQTTNGIIINGTSNNIIGKRIVSERTGNQSFQHLSHAQAYYEYCQGNYSTDDGLSQHDTTIVNAHYCSYYGNTQNINGVSEAETYLYDTRVSAGTQYGIYPTGSQKVKAWRCYLDNNPYAFYSTVSDSVFFYNCTIIDNTVGIYVNAVDVNQYTYLYGCDIYDRLDNRNNKFELWYCRFTITEAQQIFDTYSSANSSVNYCLFTTTPTTKSCIVARNAGTILNVHNCVFYGSGTKQGSGISAINGTVNTSNCIFNNLATGFLRSAGTSTSTNDCYYSNTANTSGTITITNQITTDPKFVVAGSNFSLQASSSCINTGANLGAIYQMGLKNNSIWTNAINLLNQNSYGTGWEIGSYVYEP